MLDIGLDTLTARVHRRGGRPHERTASSVVGLPYRRRSTPELHRARSQLLGGLELSYAHPVHLVGGRGVFLEAADGRRYLDAYNNVPVLGHSHPAVVDAVCSQLATLNTNSRYLQEAPVELAERLLATLPDRLDRVLLVNSGSEANDLAWRIARHATGASGGIVTSWAYHGVTEATFAFSPESWGDRPPPPHMRLVEPPPASAAAVASAVESLDAAGHGVAAMLVDGVFTSDGIRGPAHELDRGGRRRGACRGRTVRRGRGAGRARPHRGRPVELRGRPGAGRPGDAGQADGQRLPRRRRLRPRGAGGPVHRGHRLLQHVRRRHRGVRGSGRRASDPRGGARRRPGGRRRGLDSSRRCAMWHAEDPQVGDVRGWGLAVAVDIVDPATGRPDPERTARIVEGMRERGVLIGRTGRERATLKIRPPLVFGDEPRRPARRGAGGHPSRRPLTSFRSA